MKATVGSVHKQRKEGRVEHWCSVSRRPVAAAIPFENDASVRLAVGLFPAPPHQAARSGK
ncbi:MAG: hypothetical protein ACFFCW_34950 [Candidatus Hodarchaeota archaeon]